MAPTIGRLALDNGFHGSIPEDWVAPPPQNIQYFCFTQNTLLSLSVIHVYFLSIYKQYQHKTHRFILVLFIIFDTT